MNRASPHVRAWLVGALLLQAHLARADQPPAETSEQNFTTYVRFHAVALSGFASPNQRGWLATLPLGAALDYPIPLGSPSSPVGFQFVVNAPGVNWTGFLKRNTENPWILAAIGEGLFWRAIFNDGSSFGVNLLYVQAFMGSVLQQGDPTPAFDHGLSVSVFIAPSL